MSGGYRPKLIEIALPLEAISAASAREKSIRHGHISTLHLWWARRPLAACRAVLWASMVDDPSGHPDRFPTLEDQERERKRLFGILERLVPWEASNDAGVLAEARAEIEKCFDGEVPPVVDPFGGGGAIPLEAQRLGLTALAGDLNPVPVLIMKSMLEIPPRFAGQSPVFPGLDEGLSSWSGAQGLAADVEAYGQWMRDRAEEQIGHLYPDATGPNGERLTPIAWIWARTVESPDPTWSGHVPLVKSWILRKKKGKPVVWVEPVVDRDTQTITYEVREGGEPPDGTIKRAAGVCVATGAAIPDDYIKTEGQAGRMGEHLIAVVAEGTGGRIYCSPSLEDELASRCDEPDWKPLGAVHDNPIGGTVLNHGFDEWWKLFTKRQLTALVTFSDLLNGVIDKAKKDAIAKGFLDDGVRLSDGGNGATAYADALVTYLAFVVDKCADYWSNLCSWANSRETLRNVFARQSIGMTWDYAEACPFSNSTGNFKSMVQWVCKVVERLPASGDAEIVQRDARVRVGDVTPVVVSCDPPYYDNIMYADISDFFYVWMRRNLGDVWPDELATMLTPKAEELVAHKFRAGSREAAEEHFESGMSEFMARVVEVQHPDVPATIFYAYKATEVEDGDVVSTGWDTFLQAIVDAGMAITATWPIRTERPGRTIAVGANALASSVVLVCRPRRVDASLASRAEFLDALRAELPNALRVLQSGNIAPVDLAQATIGPGMKIFTQYAKVVEADGNAMPVRHALVEINTVVSEILDGSDTDMDKDTRFAVTWYAQHGYDNGSYGDADTLARARNTDLAGLIQAGIVESRDGNVRLFARAELDPEWDPVTDDRLTVWEATQYLVAALGESERDAAALITKLGGIAEQARNLCYQLFQKATDKGLTDDAIQYNMLITAWQSLTTLVTTDSDNNQQTLI